VSQFPTARYLHKQRKINYRDRRPAAAGRLQTETQMKEFFNQLGITFSLWLMDFNLDMVSMIDPKNKSKLSNSIYNKIESFNYLLFGFFYDGSEDEIFDAMNLEFGEDLTHYTPRQQQLIKTNNLL
jgi:hypothetical protein